MKKALIFLLLLAIVGGGAGMYWMSKGDSGVQFRTADIEKNDLIVTISATGTAEPVEVIDVGAQIAGRIVSFGKDEKTGQPIDFGSQVEEGTVLALIDETLYAADVQAQQAQVDQAIANRDRTKAELEQSKAQYRQAERDWKRAQEIMASNASALAGTDFDNYRAKYEIAQAAIGVAEAGIVQAEKAVALCKSNLVRAQTNLSFCTIASPVKGIIIDRRVNIGQTVVSSFSAPSLFLIAKDLRNMQVWVAVNEADIGRIHPGQPVHFSVDAFPGQVFYGTVNKIRLNASMTQNVVTYTVEVTTDNSDGKLLPYLSATVHFEVSRHEDVLIVPNTALNWSPPSSLNLNSAPPADSRTMVAAKSSTHQEAAGAMNAKEKGASTNQPASVETGTIWVLDGPESQMPRPILVTLGGSDGTNTQIESPDIREGMEVVVGVEMASSNNQGTVNPFAPKFPSRSGRSGRGGSSRH